MSNRPPREWRKIPPWGGICLAPIIVFLPCVVVCVLPISNPRSWSALLFSARAVIGFTAHFTITEESVRSAATKYSLILTFGLFVPSVLAGATRITVCQTVGTGPSSLHLSRITIPNFNNPVLSSSTKLYCLASQFILLEFERPYIRGGVLQGNRFFAMVRANAPILWQNLLKGRRHQSLIDKYI